MTLKIFGVRDNGVRDLVGAATGLDVPIPPQILDDYRIGCIEDTEAAERPSSALPIWAIYDHPSDWPNWYVARQFFNERRTGNLLLYRNLAYLREDLATRGLTPLMRHPTDDPVIMETWL